MEITADYVARQLGYEGPSKKTYNVFCVTHNEKNEPSLSVSDKRGGGILAYCHAGCPQENIVAELKRRDLWVEPPQKANTRSGDAGKRIPWGDHAYYENWGIPVDTYDYTDESGQLIFQVVRFVPKTFRQRNKLAGFWRWGAQDCRLVLYRLPQVLQSAKQGGVVFLVEGEKDADNLHNAFSYCSTTACRGAKKEWREDYTEVLKPCKMVVVIADNDDVGLERATEICSRLSYAGIMVKMIRMPVGKDFTDWLLASGVDLNDRAAVAKLKGEFAKLVRDTPEWEDPQFKTKKPERAPISNAEVVFVAEADETDTDMANAKRLVVLHGHNLRSTKERGFMVWTGNRFTPDDKNFHVECAKDVARLIKQEVSAAPAHFREALSKHAPKVQSAGSIFNMIKLASSELACNYLDFDAEGTEYLLNCRNGVLDLRTGQMIDHEDSRDFLITRICNVEYNPRARSPRWIEHLKLVFDGDQELIDYWQRWCGYCLTGLGHEQTLTFLYGDGKNGKSVTVNMLQRLLGTYALTTPTETFMARQHGVRNDVARMYGSRVVVASETNEGEKLDEGLIKLCTGDDYISARFLHKELFQFLPTFKVIMTGNNRPRLSGMDFGIRRRIHVVPFVVQIPENKRRRDIHELLMDQKEGVFAWFVEGFQKYQHSGFSAPKKILDETEEYFKANDQIRSFIEDCCKDMRKTTGRNTYTTLGALQARYRTYCKENGFGAMNMQRFSNGLKQKGFEDGREGADNTRVFYGIELSYGTSKPQGEATHDRD